MKPELITRTYTRYTDSTNKKVITDTNNVLFIYFNKLLVFEKGSTI